MKKPTITNELKAAVLDYVAACAWVKTIEPGILKTRQETLDAFPVRWDEKRWGRREDAPDTATITDPNMLYLGIDEDWAIYYAEMDKVHARLGYDVQPGYCPLMMAEHEVIKAKWSVVEKSEYFTTITVNQATNNVKRFQEIVDTIVGLVFALHPELGKR
jgi:hypothetical protein